MRRTPKSRRPQEYDLIGLLGFIVVVFNALAWLLRNLGANAGILSTIAGISLYIVVIWSGWLFVKERSKTWQVVYLIFVMLSVLAAFQITF